MLSEMPGNTGDQLIWAGSRRLLEAEKIKFGDAPLRELQEARLPQHFPGTLVIPGSGAMTLHWHEWLPGTVRRASELYDRVVILPSEYDTGLDEVREALALPNVFAFARETASYLQLKRIAVADLAPDPALYAFPFEPPGREFETDDRSGAALLALRTDAGSMLPAQDLRPSADNDDISLTATDLPSFIGVIGDADRVVTDRLHVAVAAIMLGKTVSFLDPHNEKISRYARYNFRAEFNDRLIQRDFAWARDNGYVESPRGVAISGQAPRRSA